ncbi:radiation-inducible immediate-early gene IEX-1 [Pholidichthys leucotaenia]
MYPTRSHSSTLTLRQESFAVSRVTARSTEPEIFTFDRVPAAATAVPSFMPVRPKKRCTRVMYPAKVRMHLPPPEKSQAKRWLVILCLVVLWQIYTEEPCAETPPGRSDGPVSDRRGSPLQSAEERAAQQPEPNADTATETAPSSECVIPGPACQQPVQEPDSSRSFEQSAGKSYMVALLVYHRLGSDN